MEIKNPFDVTRAVEFSDDQINSLWVDILFSRNNFLDVIKPSSPTPMIILGGKGSGKTHLMRYMSYPLQKIRHSENVLSGIASEGYLGIFFWCTGMQTDRFKGKGQLDEVWRTIFSYFLELWFSQVVLKIVIDLIRSNNANILDESALSKKIVDLFDEVPNKEQYKNIEDIVTLLVKLQKLVDVAVNNCAITGKFGDLKILLSPGKLIFGIPKLLSNNIEFFNKIQFLYLIDEFEILTIEQQKYINTLLREKELPVSFKIGSRLYGIKTYRTFGDDEENKEGSEFEKYPIDDSFRRDDKYSKFARTLCLKRLEDAHCPTKINDILCIDSFFEEFDYRVYLGNLNKRYSNKTGPHIKKLHRELLKYNIKNIDIIINNLIFSQDLLIERTNLFLFYRNWKDSGKGGLEKFSKLIHQEAKDYFNDPRRNGNHNKILEKFKYDIIAKIILDAGDTQFYCGFNTFIEMSEGIPRNLLKLLRHIYKKSLFTGEVPFGNSRISLESQNKGVQDAADWFFEDARNVGDEGKRTKDNITRLARLFREIRYSDLPPECSICAFSIDLSSLQENTVQQISNAENYSFLIRKGVRKNKNNKKMDTLFQINGILSPKWELPIYKRGELPLSVREANAIFNPLTDSEYDEILKMRLKKYNAPFMSDNSSNDDFFD